MGGLVAFEMTRKLREDGEEVFLFLLDSYPVKSSQPEKDIPPSLFAMAVVREIEDRFKTPLNLTRAELSVEDPIQKVIAVAREHGLLTTNYEEQLVRGIARVCSANLKAMQNFQASPLPGQLTLFRARENHVPGFENDLSYGWGAYCSQVEVIEVPGNHDTLLQEPNIKTLTRELLKKLKTIDL